jgi:hypothetical protein
MNRILRVNIAASVCLWSGAIYAQDFGLPGQVVLGAERLTGVYSDHVKAEVTQTITDANGNPVSTRVTTNIDSTTIAFLGTPSTLSDEGIALATSSPRLALDVFVAPGLSLGGSFAYQQRSGAQERVYTPSTLEPGGKRDLPTYSTLSFSPRIGYAVQLSPSFALWPRAGITYSNYRMKQTNNNSNGTSSTDKTSIDFTDVSLEVMAVALAMPHFAILVGPYLDLPLGGGVKATNDGVEQQSSTEVSYWSVGLSLGVAGYL